MSVLFGSLHLLSCCLPAYGPLAQGLCHNRGLEGLAISPRQRASCLSVFISHFVTLSFASSTEQAEIDRSCFVRPESLVWDTRVLIQTAFPRGLVGVLSESLPNGANA